MPILGFGYIDRAAISDKHLYGFDSRQPSGFSEPLDQFPWSAGSVSRVFLTVEGIPPVVAVPGVYARLVINVCEPVAHVFKPFVITRLALSGAASLPMIVDHSPAVIHTAVNTYESYDEIWLWVTNSSMLSATVTLTFNSGAEAVVKKLNIPSVGRFCICPGVAYGDGVEVSIASDIGQGQIMVDGYVNRLGH